MNLGLYQIESVWNSEEWCQFHFQEKAITPTKMFIIIHTKFVTVLAKYSLF